MSLNVFTERDPCNHRPLAIILNESMLVTDQTQSFEKHKTINGKFALHSMLSELQYYFLSYSAKNPYFPKSFKHS